MPMLRAINTSASGLTAERLRMDVIANNLANVNTTRTAEGGPYRRQMVVFAPRSAATQHPMAGTAGDRVGEGVRVVGIHDDQGPPRMAWDPHHPDADEEGYVARPNVDVVTEMVDLITASRAYEANVTVINSAKSMAMKALEIGRG